MLVRPGPGDVVRLRASGFSELFDDALRWASKHLDNLKTPTYGRSHLGSAIHFGTAVYDIQRSLSGVKPDVEAAVAAYLEELHNDEHVSWTDIAKSKAQSIGLNLTINYCEQISHQFDWKIIETRCEPVEIEMPNGIIFEMTGTVDRVYERDGKHGIADLKSGYAVIDAAGDVDASKHGPQLATYDMLEMMAQSTLGLNMELPAVIIALSTSNGEVAWQEIQNPRTLLFGDGESMGYLTAASHIIGNGLYIGNPRSMLCTSKYCPIYDDCFYRLGDNDGKL